LGGEWRNDLQVGRDDYFRTEWYQPLSASQRFFTAAHALTERQPFDLYNDDSLRVASFRLAQTKVGADVGMQLGDSGEVRLGVEQGRASFHNDTGAVPTENLKTANARTGGVRLRWRVDTLDSLRFPRQGYLLDVDAFNSQSKLGATYSYNKLSAAFKQAYAVGPHVFQIAMAGVTASGADDLPPHESSFLGGFQRLSGYKTDELVGNEYVLGRLVYSYRLAKAGFFDGAYAGVSLEAGRIGDSISGTGRDSNRFGSSVYVAFDTALGPLYLAYGRGDGKRNAVYFFLGQPW
jgi:NTE family protein